MLAKDKLAVIGYHMPFTAIVYVEALKGGGYRWLAHSLQLNE